MSGKSKEETVRPRRTTFDALLQGQPLHTATYLSDLGQSTYNCVGKLNQKGGLTLASLKLDVEDMRPLLYRRDMKCAVLSSNEATVIQ